MGLTRVKIEENLIQRENDALVPYVSSIGWMGIEISWHVCPKSKGGTIKRGKTWGRLIYHDMTGKVITREQAITDILTPWAIRKARVDLLNKHICAICSKESIIEDCTASLSWGWLRYMEHGMNICPECIKAIYEKSYKPWKNN